MPLQYHQKTDFIR